MQQLLVREIFKKAYGKVTRVNMCFLCINSNCLVKYTGSTRALVPWLLLTKVLRPVLLAGWDGEQRWFGGRRDLDYSAPRVQWLCTPLRGKSKAQGTRPSKPEKKGTHPIGNSRGIVVRVERLLSGSGKALDTFLCPLHESGLVEGGRM